MYGQPIYRLTMSALTQAIDPRSLSDIDHSTGAHDAQPHSVNLTSSDGICTIMARNYELSMYTLTPYHPYREGD